MKRLIYLVCLLAVNFPGVYAQYAGGKAGTGILSGKISDAATGNALPGATIFIHELKTGVVSHNDGTYTSPRLKAGKYLVEVSYQGYASIIEAITINESVEQDFALKEAIVEQEGVIVTGVTSATRIKLSPQPVIIVKRDDLVKNTSTNLIEALSKTVPGVAAIGTGPAISKPVIRGLGYNRVVVVNDGMRQEGQQWGDEHGIEIDDYSVQRVEVLKGPASLMYGSDAMGGVINIQSYTPAPEGTMGVNVLSEYQTNNRLRGVYANVTGTKKGIDWNAYGTYKGAQDYQNKYDGRVFNSRFYNKNFGGLLGYTGNWGYSRISLSNFDQHIGMVEGERDDATGAFVKNNEDGTQSIVTDEEFKHVKPLVPFQRIQHLKAVWDNSVRLGAERLDATLAYQRNQRQEFGETADIPEAYFDLKTFNYALRLQLAEHNNWKTSLGVTGMYQNNKNKAEERLIPDYDLFDIGGFLFTQYTRDKLTVSGGLRFDNRHINSLTTLDGTDVKFEAFSKSFSNVSGSVGLSYAASQQTTFKLNLSRGFRAPNMAELASNGAHEGTNRYEVGNGNLKSETSLQVDAGVALNTEHVSVNASLFYNNIRNFIFYEKMQGVAGGDSVIADPDGDLMVFQFDQHNANLYGGEISVDIHPHPLDWLHFENAFSYTRAQFTSEVGGTRNIPFIPAGRLVSELKGNFLPKGNMLRNIYASVESDYNFAQNKAFTGFNTETATGSYWLMNAGIGADIVSHRKRICTISVNGLNLADIAYQNHLNRLKYNPENMATGRMGVFNMGRNFSIKVNVPLSFKI